MKLIRKRLPTTYRNRNNNTQARSEEETPQIQKSLREHNKGKKNNKQHEKTKTTTRERNNNNEDETRQPTQETPLSPPPEGEWSFMWGSSPRHERGTKQTNSNREEREGPQRVETNCTLHSSERTQST